MGKRILNYIKKYTIGHKCFHLFFLGIGIVFIIISFNSKPQDNINPIKSVGDNIGCFALNIFLFVFWILSYIIGILWLFYHGEFGRNLIYDIWHLKQSPFYLISYFVKSNPNKLDSAEFQKENWKQAKGIVFGYSKEGNLVRFDSETEMNCAIFGSPGSAKTVGYVKPNARCFGGSVLAVDIKGDIFEYNKHYRKIIRFAPDIPDAIYKSARFNPFEGFDKLSRTELKLRVLNMAEILIPMDSQKEPYFSVTARKMFTGFLLYLLGICKDLTFPEFLQAVLHNKRPSGYKQKNFPSNIFEWIECVVDSGIDAAVEQVVGLIGNNERNIAGCYDRLNTALIPFSNPVLDKLLSGKGKCISSQTLYDGYDVYLQISQNNLSVYSPLFTMIINSFLSDFANRPDTAFHRNLNRPILCILDEFPRLTFPYDTIDSFLSTLRSKSVVMMPVCQSVAQLFKKYGDDGAQALLGNCTYQVCCRANDEITRTHFIQIIGTKKTLKESTGSIEADKPVYPPYKYGNLNDTAIVYLNGKHAELTKIKGYQ